MKKMQARNEPLLIWSSILVTLQVITGGAVLAEAIGEVPAGLGILTVAGFQAGTQFYIRGKVTPTSKTR